MSSSFEDPGAEIQGEDRAAERRRRRGQQMRDRRRRYLTAGLAVGLCTLLVNAIVGENGYLAAARLRAEEAELAGRVTRLRLDNQALKRDAERLRRDPAALEETARAELGLVRPGEVLVIIRDAAPAGTPAPRR